MKCEKVKELIHSDAQLPSAVSEHLTACENCRRYKQDIRVMVTKAPAFQTSEKLDNKVLDFARNYKQDVVPLEDKKPLNFVWLGAVAALLILSFTMTNLFKAQPLNTNLADATQDVIIEKDGAPHQLVEVDAGEKIDVDFDNLWSDDELDSELMALQGELSVLDAEFYLE